MKDNPKESEPLLLQQQHNTVITEDVAVCIDSTMSSLSVNAPQKEMYGYFLILLSCLFYAVLWTAVRYVTSYRGIAVSALVFLRGFIQVVLGLIWTFTLLDYKKVLIMQPSLLRLVILRGVLGSMAMATHFTAIRLIPIGIATTLFFTNPIITIFLSNLTLGERVGKREIIATVLSFTGVVFVAGPWDRLSSTKLNWVGLILALLGAALASGAYTAMRSVAPQVSFMSNVLSLGVCATMVGVILSGTSIQSELSRDSKGTIFAVIGCIAGFLGQCCVSEAYRYCRAGTGALMRNLDLPLVYLCGLFILDEIPKIFAVFGSFLVVLGSVILGFEALKRRR